MKKNNRGFSLIELMIVVAIIGILSAIAIPNFQRFQRKARQSEIKSHLSGIFTAEKAFFAEWNQYFSDLEVIGYIPDGNLLYNAGFATASTPALPITYTGTPATGRATTAAVCGGGAAGVNCVDASGGAALPAVVDPAGVGVAAVFTAGGSGNIGGANIDQWTITHGKVLANTQDGL